MYHHVKKLMYTVNIGEPDPRFGNMLLEQFGGANGELAAAMQYSIQGFNCEDPARKDLLMDIGTEELSHLEVVGALIRMHLKPMKSDRLAAEADPLVSIAGGGGVALFNSVGDAWTADYLKITGDLAVDLHSNIAAEARAKIVYERLINFTDDQGTKEALQFLMTREITHMRAFTAALETMGKPRFSIGTIAPTEGLVDEYFNDSTGEGDEGQDGLADNIVQAAKLTKVDSEVFGGDGLDITPETPVPNSEKTSKMDSTPVGRKPVSRPSVVKKTGTGRK
jgi:Mn-containing catalase